MMFAFAAVGTFLATYGGYIAAACMAVGAGVSIYSSYQANSAAHESARQQESAAQAAADAQRMAAEAQAQQAKDQADLAKLQAGLEDKKAAVAQEAGQIEAQRRMVQLSLDIGNTYAQWAGNGLLVDGGSDTLGALLTAQTREGATDVGIINANTANSVWEHQMNKAAAEMSEKSYLNQAENYSLLGEANANATLSSGAATAYATRQAGLTALYKGWGSGISMIGGAAYGAGSQFAANNPTLFSSMSTNAADWAYSGGWSSTNTTPTVANSTPLFANV